MNDKIVSVDFNDGQKRDREIFGTPLHPSWHTVVIEGRTIPLFHIREHAEQIEVMFDNRWVFQFSELWQARVAVTMAAEALAVGMGYSHLGASDRNHPFAPIRMEIIP